MPVDVVVKVGVVVVVSSPEVVGVPYVEEPTEKVGTVTLVVVVDETKVRYKVVVRGTK